MCEGLETAIFLLNKVLNIVSIVEDEEGNKYYPELSEKDIETINKLVYKVYGYLIALSDILNVKKHTIKDMEEGRFNFNLLKIKE